MTTDNPRVVFMGSPEFAVPALRALAARYSVVAVVTQPDRPHGRGLELAPPPVKTAALALGLPVLQPEKLRTPAARAALAALGADLFVVVAYGKILSAKMLAVPRLGCVNVHASLLPAYRGAAPIQWAVIRGEVRSGITIMLLDEGMDTGPMLLQRELELAPDETAGSLHDRLAPLGAAALLEALPAFVAGTLRATPQPTGCTPLGGSGQVADPTKSGTLAPLLAKEDGRVDFSRPAREVGCWIRGMDPWPGAFTTLAGERLKLFAARAESSAVGRPGEVLAADDRGLLVACGVGGVWIRELQLAGRKRLAAAALLAGRPISPGVVLGAAG